MPEQAMAGTEPGTVRRLWPSWVALAIVLVVALVLGSRGTGTSTGAGQRIAHLESEVRCPSCSGLSVAESDASTAVAVRASIRQQVAAGRSDAEVEAYLVERYGPSILLSPPTSGISFLVWLLPVVVVGLAAGGIGYVLWGRRRRGRALAGGERAGPRGPAGAHAGFGADDETGDLVDGPASADERLVEKALAARPGDTS